MIDDTITEDFFALGGDAKPARQVLPRAELLARLTSLMRSCEGCANVRVTGVMPFDRPDEAGCNWGLTLWIDPAGVAPEVYGLAYAQIIPTARGSWNLQPDPEPRAMRIWVYADALPAAAKYVLFRAAERRKVMLTMVAHKQVRVPESAYLKALQVPRWTDAAESPIAREVAPGDLVVTADAALTGLVTAKGALALDPAEHKGRKQLAEQMERLLAKA